MRTKTAVTEPSPMMKEEPRRERRDDSAPRQDRAERKLKPLKTTLKEITHGSFFQTS